MAGDPTRSFERLRLEASELAAEYQSGRRDFDRVDLSGVDLSGLALEAISLVESDLRDCRLDRCSLRGANLTAAVLNAASMTGADLRNSNLSYADLSDADLSGASLWGARLGNTCLVGTTLTNAHGWRSLRRGTEVHLAEAMRATVTENAREATKHAGVLFLTQLTIALYGAFTIVSVNDAEFLGSAATIKLPIVDVSVRTSVFFAALPLILFSAQVYYLFYYRVARGLWRVLGASGQERRFSQHERRNAELTRYPWIGLLVLDSTPAARIAHAPFFVLSWMTTPLFAWIAWIKTSPFRSTLALWTRDGAPSSAIFATAFLTTLPLFVGWASYEDALERGVVEVRRLSLYAVALCGVFVGAAASADSYAATHRLQLVNAEISRRPVNLEQDPRGAVLPRVQLAQSKARRIYLAFANLNEANLRDANLFGATLTEAYLIDANLAGANLHESKGEGADAGGANFFRAFLGSSNWSRAQFACADLREAKLKRANFSEANLGGANIRGAFIEEAIFRDADLRHADLSNAFGVNAHFEGALFDEATRFPDGKVPATARPSREPAPRYLCK